MTHEQKKRRTARRRLKLRETVALEARDVMNRSRKLASMALKMYEDIIADPTERTADRIAAGQVILDRAYGKANQTNTNITVDANGKPTEVSGKELNERIAATLKRIEELTGGTSEERPRKERPADIRQRDGDPGGSTFH